MTCLFLRSLSVRSGMIIPAIFAQLCHRGFRASSDKALSRAEGATGRRQGAPCANLLYARKQVAVLFLREFSLVEIWPQVIVPAFATLHSECTATGQSRIVLARQEMHRRNDRIPTWPSA
eukprot:scaffold25117_cov30-Tisochrysis_lutea.AAC.2